MKHSSTVFDHIKHCILFLYYLFSPLLSAFKFQIKATPLVFRSVFFDVGIFHKCTDFLLVEILYHHQKKGVFNQVYLIYTKYFEKIEDITVGTISSMYTIFETTTEAGYIIQIRKGKQYNVI